jgi:hypothetical protein
MLHGIGVPLKEELVIETGASLSGESTTSATISYRKDPSIVLTIQLPAPVYAGQLTSLVVQDIHLEAKLRAVPTSTPGSITSLNTVLTHALSAQEMRRIQPTDIRCAQCDRDIVNLPATNGPLEQTYKDLPSEHWAEMMDVWMCHDDPTFTAKLAKNTKDGFWPNKGSILIGGSYFLVHGDDLQLSSVEVESSLVSVWQQSLLPVSSPSPPRLLLLHPRAIRRSSFSPWTTLRCPLCRSGPERSPCSGNSKQVSVGGGSSALAGWRCPGVRAPKWSRYD